MVVHDAIESLASSPDDTPASLCSAPATLAFVWVEQREVVVVRQFLSRLDVTKTEQSHPIDAIHSPLLNFTVGLASVINKP